MQVKNIGMDPPGLWEPHTLSLQPLPQSCTSIRPPSARMYPTRYQVKGLWWYLMIIYSPHFQIHLFLTPTSIFMVLWHSFVIMKNLSPLTHTFENVWCTLWKIWVLWRTQLRSTLCLLVSVCILWNVLFTIYLVSFFFFLHFCAFKMWFHCFKRPQVWC